jgi:hypothetical protein
MNWPGTDSGFELPKSFQHEGHEGNSKGTKVAAGDRAEHFLVNSTPPELTFVSLLFLRVLRVKCFCLSVVTNTNGISHSPCAYRDV